MSCANEQTHWFLAYHEKIENYIIFVHLNEKDDKQLPKGTAKALVAMVLGQSN